MPVGKGYAGRTLTGDETRSIIAEGVAAMPVDGKRVLVIVPDHTRTCPIGTVFPLVLNALRGRAKSVEVMVALGTHPPEDEAEVRRRLFTPPNRDTQDRQDGERPRRVSSPKEPGAALRASDPSCPSLLDEPPVTIHQHEWDRDEALAVAGHIEKDEVGRITRGLFKMRVCVRANRRLFPPPRGQADHLLVIGPVFPHEVAGFSGGGKYLFPGCSGPEVLDFFHWLGAVITNVEIIGVKDTPVREVVDRAAALVPTPKSAIKMVVTGGGDLHGLWAGDVKEAWSAAADLSARVHVTYLERPVKQVLSVAPRMYDDLWTAGKCVYKLEPVVADGGEIIVYAPHVTEVSYTHGAHLDEVGYHVRDFFLRQWDRYKGYPWSVLAHSTHVKGAGEYDAETGVERPRVNVVLATGIPEERCRKINLGYRDPATIDPEDFKGRDPSAEGDPTAVGEGVLLVPKAGEMLYRLKA